MTIGDRIHHLRAFHDWSPEVLAEKTGRSVALIRQCEESGILDEAVAILAALANAFEMSIPRLVGDEPVPETHVRVDTGRADADVAIVILSGILHYHERHMYVDYKNTESSRNRAVDSAGRAYHDALVYAMECIRKVAKGGESG